MSRDQNAGRNYNVKSDNSPFEWGGRVQIFLATLTNENTVQQEIKSRFKLENACYLSVHNLCLLVCCLKI